MTGMFKRLKKNKTTAVQMSAPTPPPRPMDEIVAEERKIVDQLGRVTYGEYLQKQEIARLNNELVRINQEAGARYQIDAEEKAKQEAAQATNEAGGN